MSVPMNPEYLPEGALLIAGAFTAVASVRYLAGRRRGHALRAGAASLACFALAFTMAKTLHHPPGPPVLRPSTSPTMSLVLGGVVLRVAPSERYVLSVEGRRFLVLDLARGGLTATGVVGSEGQAAASIRGNTVPVGRVGIRPERDDHTLLLHDPSGRNIFQIHYAEPFRIEVTGRFFEGTRDRAALISFENGIHWIGRDLSPGTVIDLAGDGSGRIDFDRTGSVRMLHES